MLGLAVLGVSPRRVLDAAYRAFFEVIADHIGAAIANVKDEAEQHRVAIDLQRLRQTLRTARAEVAHASRVLAMGELADRSHTRSTNRWRQ